MDDNTISVRKIVIKNDLEMDGVTLLTYTIEYPEFYSCQFLMCRSEINKFYRCKALELKSYYETKLFCMAVKQYKDAVENGFPFHAFEAIQTYTITYLYACIISIYFDSYQYTGGAHGNTVRKSQTWDLQQCGLLKLCQLVRCPPDCKSYILDHVKAQIETNPDIYFDNYEELIDEQFNKNSFYCTPDGIVIYYQQYDIAPYSSGIREFLIPYNSCVLRPEILC